MRNRRYTIGALVLSPLWVVGCAAIAPALAPGGPADPAAAETPLVSVSSTLRSYKDFTSVPRPTLPEKQPSAGPPEKPMKNMPGMSEGTMPGMDHGAPQ